jgi:UDP-hydrolysing UDP-N-acetyl-D-glucosamine 2-epimerase
MRRVAIVTGTRAEWGLLEPIASAACRRDDLELVILAGGAHLVPLRPSRLSAESDAPTIGEVDAWARDRNVAVRRFEMQRAGETGRFADAAALGRGIGRLTELFREADPDFVVVLGDRIEALAAASAAAVAGIRAAHVHGGDRAEGIADEAIRHAVSKLAHIHFAASPASAARLLRLGEDAARVHLVGSPAIDGLTEIKAVSSDAATDAGAAIGIESGKGARFVFLMHPVGRDDADEERDARLVLEQLGRRGRTLVLLPNLDPGRDGIVRAIEDVASESSGSFEVLGHLSRRNFLTLVRRPEVVALVGNSSAGLIECAALGVRAVNVGPRQNGRERADNVCDVAEPSQESLALALDQLEEWRPSGQHPFGDGSPASRIAEILGTVELARCPVRKRNAF